MIITQTPLRIGLVGGGTDLPGYYREHGGRVLNAAIDKYVYVIVKQRFDDDIYVNYSRKEIVSRVEDIQHELVREAMHMAGVRGGIEITTLADIPSAGSGLGSSSSVTVGLLNALFTYQGKQLSAEELADRACAIEIDRCRKPIGKQDQYAAAFGGICDIRFGPGDRVMVDPVVLASPLRRRAAGRAAAVLHRHHPQRGHHPGGADRQHRRSAPQLGQLRDLAGEAVAGCGRATSGAWGRAVQELGGQAGARLRRVEQRDRQGGGGRAGRRGVRGEGHRRGRRRVPAGHLRPDRQLAVRERLAHMQELPIKLEPLGSRVIFNVHRDIFG